MNVKQAIAQCRKQKTNQGYFIIEAGFGDRYLLPYDAGIQFMESLRHAEEITDYYRKPKVTGLASKSIQVMPISEEEYLKYKVASLLDLSKDDMDKLDLNKPEQSFESEMTESN